jgi:hypothetical protein
MLYLVGVMFPFWEQIVVDISGNRGVLTLRERCYLGMPRQRLLTGRIPQTSRKNLEVPVF